VSRIGACFGRQLLGRRGRFTKAGTYESRFYSTGRTSPRYLWCDFEHDVKRRGGIRFDLQFRPAEPPKAGRLCPTSYVPGGNSTSKAPSPSTITFFAMLLFLRVIDKSVELLRIANLPLRLSASHLQVEWAGCVEPARQQPRRRYLRSLIR